MMRPASITFSSLQPRVDVVITGRSQHGVSVRMSGEGVRSVGGDRLEIAAKRPFGMTVRVYPILIDDTTRHGLMALQFMTWIRYSENVADRESLNKIDEAVQFLLWSSHKGLCPDIDHAIRGQSVTATWMAVDVMLNSDHIEEKEWNNSDDIKSYCRLKKHINLPVKLQIVVIGKGDETKATYLVKNRPIQAFGAYLPCLTLGPGGSRTTLFTAHLSATSGRLITANNLLFFPSVPICLSHLTSIELSSLVEHDQIYQAIKMVRAVGVASAASIS
ncbi:hypothetical protein AZE42_07652 [Rhizopogon vesiculosus]|uniref:Uncharacterized protein n=1 Tax=Rhizopogon vesiculosus TaxID=180088 RepID=A0A1J8PN78_9AGAM|nr:hypothetical protein AZE42_07652 [Rhizopogon vesiculosus]